MLRPPASWFVCLAFLFSTGAASCAIAPGDDVQRAVNAAAANGTASCDLASGRFALPLPLLLPQGFTLTGAGPNTTELSLAGSPFPSAQGWPALPPGQVGVPLALPLEAVVIAASGATLRGVGVHCGLSGAVQSAATYSCGLGFGSDAVHPGPAGCRWTRFGVYGSGVTGFSVKDASVTACTTGVVMVGASGVTMSNVAVNSCGGPAYGKHLGAVLLNETHGATLATVSATNTTSGPALAVLQSSSMLVSGASFTHGTHDGALIVNSTNVTLSGSAVEDNLGCGVQVDGSTAVTVASTSVFRSAISGQGGLCASQASQVKVTACAAVNNSVNVFAKDGSSVTLDAATVDVCSAYYTPLCAVDTSSVTLLGKPACNVTTSTSACSAKFSLGSSELPLRAAGLPASAPPPTASPACNIAVGDDIQAALDSAAAGGVRVCTLAAGTFAHPLSTPLYVPANMTLRGAGAGNTVIQAVLPDPDSRPAPCEWADDCAVISVRNSSRVNLAIVDLTVDGGITPAHVRWTQTHCGRRAMGGMGPRDMPGCGWTHLGVLVWDYYDGGSPSNLTLSGVEIRHAAMGLHVLGTNGVTLSNVHFHDNGMGNAFYHNAYFLRTSNILIEASLFSSAFGHGVKLGPTIANVTVVDSEVSYNHWQGMWIGDTVTNLTLTNVSVIGNHENGLQIASTSGLHLAGCTFAQQPNADGGHAALSLDGVSDAVISNCTMADNAVNLIARNVKNVAMENVVCSEAWYPPAARVNGDIHAVHVDCL